MTRPLLCLVMMVKDEAKTIRKTLESVKPFVDRWYILDTGSTDNTLEIAIETMEGVPGWTKIEPFVDYATTRNRALELATDRYAEEDCSVFTLMLSADEVLEGGDVLRTCLEGCRDKSLMSEHGNVEGAYAVTMQNGPQQWPYTRILRTDAKWRYRGAIQERPVGPNGEVDGPVIPGVKVIFTDSDLDKKQKRLREVDVPLLTRAAEDKSKPWDERTRAMYFLGDTHAMIAADCEKDKDGEYDQRSEWLTHNMMAMSYYWRYSQATERDPNGDRDKAMRGYFYYYHIADKIGFWAPQEMFSRLKILCEAAPKFGMAHFMLADIASRIDVRQGLFHALEAAKVAKEERENPPLHAAIDARTEWLCLRIAAECAKMMKNDDQAKQLARRAIEAGAPFEVFRGIL